MKSQEYNQCVSLFADRLYRFILKNVGQEADARDIVQNAFEKLWKKHKNVSFEKSRAWLFQTAYRDMIDQYRKMKRIEYQEELPEQSEEKIIQGFELKDMLEQALNKLSEIQRSLILLRDYEGYSYKEIGEITNLSEAQVKVYIFRARKHLQIFLSSLNKAI